MQAAQDTRFMAFDINFYEEWNAMNSDEVLQSSCFNFFFAGEIQAVSKAL